MKLWLLSLGQCITTIKDSNGFIYSVVWQKIEEGKSHLITAGADKTIRKWSIEGEDKKPEAVLEWTSYQATLTATETRIKGAVGLSEANAQLLRQLGAEIQ